MNGLNPSDKEILKDAREWVSTKTSEEMSLKIEFENLKAENARLRGALDRYGTHFYSCELHREPNNHPYTNICSCGFHEALKGEKDGGK